MRYEELTSLKTEHLLLRKLRLSDAPFYYQRIGSSERVTKFMLWQPHRSQQESHESIERILDKYETGRCYTWAIALKEDDSLIGRIDLLRLDEARNCCSFAYMLGEDFWGRGFGTEALKAVFSFAFEVLRLESITVDHMTENAASGRVMQKAGMRFVKRIPSRYEKNGVLHDADEYRITAADWKRSNQ